MVKRFVKTLQPLRATATILGIFPLKLANHNATLTILECIQNCIYLTIYVACFSHYYNKLSRSLPGDFTKMNTVMYGLKFRRIGNVTVMCVTLVATILNRKKLLSVYEKISEVDVKLGLLGQKENIRRSNQRNGRNLVLLVVVVDLVYYIIGTWLTLSARKNNSAVEFIAIAYPLLVIANFNFTFYGIMTALQDRFKIVNEKILMTAPSENAIFCKSLEHLVAVHRNLTRLSRNINSVFSLHLLLWITLTCIAFVIDLYVLTWLLVMGFGTKYSSIVVNLIKNITMYIFDLFCFCYKSRQLCREVR